MFLLQDIRYSLCTIWGQPLFATIAILTMALGIGASTAVFSVVNSVLLKPLPFEEPDELVGVWHSAPGWGGMLNQTPATYFTYRAESRVFEDIGLWLEYSATVTGLDRPERVECSYVADGTLSLLRLRPLLGRTFSPADELPDAAPTVVLVTGTGGAGSLRTVRLSGRRLVSMGNRLRSLVCWSPDSKSSSQTRRCTTRRVRGDPRPFGDQ